ncbi:MAG: histidinol-phosphate transaminase, partial [Kiloniellales bacterium]|nr:histidinol-phosphate transaminase [Kiloniellales bacterium]
VCGAGSDELISLLMRAYAGPGDEIIHSAHGFLMYAISARSVGARPVSAPEADLKADVDAIVVSLTPATRMVFLANPNNPTGSYLPASALAELRRRLPENVLLVIDAAYAEYVEEDDYANGAELVSANDNVVMLRTFSKIHGLAALRLGWAYCPPGIVDVLHRLRGPFNVGAPALAAGIAAVEDREHQERSRLHNRRLLSRFKSEVEALGLLAPPSYGNFILLRFPAGADQAEQALEALKSRGVLVRGMRGYGLQDSLRVTIGLEEEMKVTREALSEFLS